MSSMDVCSNGGSSGILCNIDLELMSVEVPVSRKKWTN
jgi:hypothetical protein